MNKYPSFYWVCWKYDSENHGIHVFAEDDEDAIKKVKSMLPGKLSNYHSWEVELQYHQHGVDEEQSKESNHVAI